MTTRKSINKMFARFFRIKNLSIYPLTLIFIISLVVFSSIIISASWVFIETNSVKNEIKTLKDNALERKRNELKIIVSGLINYLEHDQANNPDLSQEKIQDAALSYLESIRFGNDGYVFVNTYDGIALLFNGKILEEPVSMSKLDYPSGLNFYETEMELAKLPEGGSFQYSFKKINEDKLYPKLSYIMGFDQWRWIVGVGDYLDDLSAEILPLENNLKVELKRHFITEAFIVFPLIVLCLFISIFVSRFFLNQFNKFGTIYQSYLLEPDKNNEMDQVFIKELRAIGYDLIRAEDKFQIMYNNSPDMYVSVSPDNASIIMCNETLLKKTGYSKKEIIGYPVFNLYHDDCLTGAKEAFKQFVETGKIKDKELILKRKDGSMINVSLNASAVRDESGKILYSISSWRDITERIQSEMALSEAYTIINRSPTVAFLWKNEQNWPVEFVTDNVEKIFGYSAKEFQKGTILYSNVIHKDDLDIVIKEVSDFSKVKGLQNFAHQAYRIITKNGEVKWVDDKTFIRRDSKGAITHYEGIVYDITEREQAVEALRISEEKFAKAFQSSPDIIILTSLIEGRIIEVNENLHRTTGYMHDEIIGKKTIEVPFWANPIERELYIKTLQQDGRVLAMEVGFRIKSGEIRDTLLSGEIIELQDGKYILSVIRDITELNKAYKEIKELKDKLQAENIYLRKSYKTSDLHQDIVGSSPQIKELVEKALQVAKLDSNVLLLGETGTGKELIANGIHNTSRRKDKVIITVNCAAIPESLIESELFGHEKGAFTDAQRKKIGLFEIADGSTIFLDEIGELPYNVQSKLLRVIESREFTRVGSNQSIKVDVRIISATNQDLKTLIKEKKFRQDLYYRLNVFPIELPPLRTRKEDIKLLIEKFVGDFNSHMGKNISNISKKFLEEAEKYNWPGNVRELKNIVERSMIISIGNTLKLNISLLTQTTERTLSTLEDIERNHIEQILESTYWKISGKGGAAEILGINPSTLRSRIEKLGISKK